MHQRSSPKDLAILCSEMLIPQSRFVHRWRLRERTALQFDRSGLWQLLYVFNQSLDARLHDAVRGTGRCECMKMCDKSWDRVD